MVSLKLYLGLGLGLELGIEQEIEVGLELDLELELELEFEIELEMEIELDLKPELEQFVSCEWTPSVAYQPAPLIQIPLNDSSPHANSLILSLCSNL